jgi:hypothetical protein
VRVQRDLKGLKAFAAQRAREFAERRGRVVRDAELPDPAGVALGLEPRQVLLPRDQVVHLLDLDAVEPGELIGELATGLPGRRRPDLREHRRVVAAWRERGAERLFGAVHRRRVEAPAAGGERRVRDGPGEAGVAAKGVPGSEAHHGTKPAFLHQPSSSRATRPAA